MPNTTNILLTVPDHGTFVNTWDMPVNGDFTSIDGLFGGVQAIAVSASPVTLTAPAGTPTPAGGPYQAQNAVLRFTGTMSANVTVTLPLPGYVIIENLTTGNFVLSFRAVAAGEVIAVDQGEVQHVYNDGTNVRFVNLGRVGETQTWAGLAAMPAWVTACTKKPYLLCDGTIYNFSDFPYLGRRLGSSFGGNGITTFGVPDHRGRIPLIYDGTGTRITAAGCGINGQTLGAFQDKQTNSLVTANLPPYTPSGTISQVTGTVAQQGWAGTTGSQVNTGLSYGSNNGTATAFNLTLSSQTFTGTAQGGTSTAVNNVQPSQVTGISVIRAA